MVSYEPAFGKAAEITIGVLTTRVKTLVENRTDVKATDRKTIVVGKHTEQGNR